MKKLSIKRIIEFRGKSDKGKKNFASNLKIEKVNFAVESGGDYWISCLSALSNSYKSNDFQAINDKMGELEKKYKKTVSDRIKTMYKRNIDILFNYKDFDLKKWRPAKKIHFLKKHKEKSILPIRGLQVQVTPHHVFTIQRNDGEDIGAIWFIAKLNGFRKDELGMFADILYRYLKTHFSKEYDVNSKYCIAVDVFTKSEVNYSQIEKKEIPSLLNSTLDEINKLM